MATLYRNIVNFIGPSPSPAVGWLGNHSLALGSSIQPIVWIVKGSIKLFFNFFFENEASHAQYSLMPAGASSPLPVVVGLS